VPYSNYAALFQGVERPSLLYLALLLHDVGKPTGTANTRRSARTWPPARERLKLDGSATHTLRTVIEIICSWRAFRSGAIWMIDSYPQFREVGADPGTLTLLTLHTSPIRWPRAKTLERLSRIHSSVCLQQNLPAATGGVESVRAEKNNGNCSGRKSTRLLLGQVDEEECMRISPRCRPRYFQILAAAGNRGRPAADAPLHALAHRGGRPTRSRPSGTGTMSMTAVGTR